MDQIEQSWSQTDVIKLTLDLSDSELDRQLQQDACKGICQDMILMGQCDGDEEEPLPPCQKHWPLVVVDREKSQRPTGSVPHHISKRSSWRGRHKQSRMMPGSVAPLHPETVDLVFVHEDKDSCVQAIEVCSTPSNKIKDLHTLQRSTPRGVGVERKY